MLTGPSIVSCSSSAEGFGQCLQGRLADAGLLPRQPAPPVIAESEQPAAQTTASAEATAEAEEAVAEPALDVVPATAETAAVPDNLIAATFGLLRAEPDGSVVIAGSGTPGSEIEVYANGSLLGRATVETSGDWVLVPDAPLPAGPLEITLGEKGKTGQAAQSFVVVIDEDKTSQPLVVASTPGQASDILQGLERPAATPDVPTAEVAAADPVTQPAPLPPSAQPATDPAAPVATIEPPAEAVDTPAPGPVSDPAPPAMPPAGTDRAAPVDAPVDAAAPDNPSVPATEPTVEQTPPSAAPETAAATASPPAAPEADAAPRSEIAPAQPSAADAPATPQPQSDPQPASGPVESAAEAQVATLEPAPAETPAAAPAQASEPPSIDAIELEDDRTFFAGGGPEGGIVRLYVDDSYIADATIAGGRWLVEAGPVLGKPSQRIRVDLLGPGSATVVARAEVDFVVNLPQAEPLVAEAEAATPAPAEAPTARLPDTGTQGVEASSIETPAGVSGSEMPQTTPPATAPEASASEPAAVPAAPVAEPTLSPEPAIAQAPAAQAPVAPPDQPVAQAPTVSEPVPTPTPTAPPAQPPVADIPTMVAVSIGGVDAQRFAAGKAIIRRGDNLWTIARRVYGSGVKFTTIYEANTGQIRDPDRIYPGQVFNLPTE